MLVSMLTSLLPLHNEIYLLLFSLMVCFGSRFKIVINLIWNVVVKPITTKHDHMTVIHDQKPV